MGKGELIQTVLSPEFSLGAAVASAIAALHYYEPIAIELDPRGYHLCYSGGKDSEVIRALARRAGVRHTVHRNVCPDPPELVAHVRRACPEAIWERAPESFWRGIVRKGLPTRKMRWCCAVHKERGGRDRVKILGVRAAESRGRRERAKLFTRWEATKSWALNPIVWWSDAQVWEFIHTENLPYCELYDQGFKRLGCVGCPCARRAGRLMELKRWPQYERLWRQATHRLWDRKAGTKQRDGREWCFSAKFNSPDEVFEWWLSDKSLPGEEPGPDDDCWLGMW